MEIPSARLWKLQFLAVRDVSLCKFIFSSAFIPVGNDVTIRKSLLCAVMALFTKVEWRVHLSDGQKIQTYPDEKEYVSGCVSLLI